MNDDVKEAVERARWVDWTDPKSAQAAESAVAALLRHIDAEPERLAAAVAREREEQREALGLDRWPMLIPFLAAMAGKLDANRAKKGGREGWQNQEPGSLVRRVIEEAEELEHAVDTKGAREILLEAADVANMAMMVADASGSLDTPEPLTATPLADELERSWQETARMEERTEERARVVAWLRRMAPTFKGATLAYRATLQWAADRIERGEHEEQP